MRVVIGLRIVVVLALLTSACGGTSSSAPPSRPAVQEGQLTVDGVVRTYRVFAPTSLERESDTPLVLVLGGVGNDAEGMVGATQFDREATAGNFVVAYPEGLGQSWNAGFCCGSTATDGVDDVDFLSSVIDRLQADYGIDADRVYVVGVSAGAMMAYRLGCEAADRIAGVGSVAGAMILDQCQPTRPVPVIEIHGTDDPLVPYDGGVVRPEGVATQPAPSTPAVAQRWASLNDCSSDPEEGTEGPVTTLTWTGCAQGSAVKLVTVDGGGHTWFATGLGPANGAVDATQLMWGYFDSLSRSG
ncbi:MAG: esterase [Actinomycetota bacterium]|jgi:polyhydroxybutyrate depolymerase|nr:esterase [Actinomycetota bacterium]